MPQIKLMDEIKRGVVSVLYVAGSAVTAYNVTAFKAGKNGIYFLDDNQIGLAIGVALVVTGWLVRNWKKL